jgi:hypothetical protein
MPNVLVRCKVLIAVQLFSFDDRMRSDYPRVRALLCPAQESAHITVLFPNFAELPAQRRPVRHRADIFKGHCGR